MFSVDVDTILLFSDCAAEVTVIGLLFYRHVWRGLPAFVVYSVWSLLSSAGGYAILRHYGFYSSAYVTAYLVEIVIDSILLFGVLVEVAWSALRPVHASLPRSALIVVAGLILVASAVIWPFATVPGTVHLSRNLSMLMQLQQTLSILRIVLFLVLAGGSHLLSIGWRDRELQIATGLGIYSLVSVVVSMLHTYPALRAQYNRLDEIVVASYLCSLVYWIFSFAHKEPERREFTPQMQNLFLAAAGAARSTRIALTQSRATKVRKNGDQ